jgi:hypothetical protein
LKIPARGAPIVATPRRNETADLPPHTNNGRNPAGLLAAGFFNAWLGPIVGWRGLLALKLREVDS